MVPRGTAFRPRIWTHCVHHNAKSLGVNLALSGLAIYEYLLWGIVDSQNRVAWRLLQHTSFLSTAIIAGVARLGDTGDYGIGLIPQTPCGSQYGLSSSAGGRNCDISSAQL